MRRRITVAALFFSSGCWPPPVPDVETVEMLWIDPPTEPPGIQVRPEPNTVDLAFANGPSHHILLQSAPILAMLRSRGKKRLQVVFHVTRARLGSEVRGYTLVSIADYIFNPDTDRELGSFKMGVDPDPLPFSQ